MHGLSVGQVFLMSFLLQEFSLNFGMNSSIWLATGAVNAQCAMIIDFLEILSFLIAD